ncbi:hypothetical protein HY440_01270, partial [Candidatus Microgenomates bacterium]|nr:hypothetical protein [Candidatus Microgenomates bacterium]
AAQPVNAGAHTSSETVDSGYTASSWSGDCAANGTVTLSLGQNATCTITNNDNAPSLTLVKQVLNDDGGQAVASAWTLTASGPTGFSGTGPSVSNGASFDAGTYDLSESGGPTGYSASAWVCTGGNQTDDDTVVVGLGDQVTCTIVNDDNAAHLIVIKQVVNDNGGTAGASDFTLDSGGANDSPDDFAGQEAPGTNVTLNAGSYLVTESGPSGYSASYSADCSGTIANGQTKTCTVTNNDIQPKLTVTKVVVNDNGGDKVVSDFPLFVDATSVTSGQENGFNAGTYTVSETTQDGYSPSISGDCDSNGSVTLAVGDVKSCTITNDDIAPTLTVNKVLSPSDDPGLFDLQIDDTTYASDVTDGGTTGAIALSANTEYTVGENAGTGTNLSDYTNEISGDCDTDGLITMLPGEAKTCTITNTRRTGNVTFQKIVSGGTAVASNWDFTVEGVAGTFHDGDSVDLNTGTYLATESSQVSGYTPTSASGICSNLNGSTATLTVTENGGTCTFTNTRDTGTIIVNKEVDSNSDGVYEGGNTANTLGFRWSLDGGDANRLMGSDQSITTGDKHEVNENSVPGYAFTGWYETNSEDFSCRRPESTTLPVSFTVTKDQTRSITLCNQLQNPILTISKSNNAGGDKAPGDNVTFTLTVTATQSAAFNVKVTDLPAGGFGYHAGSWTATRNGVPFSLPEPVYHSPGVWQIGDMAVNDVVVLTYLADIDGGEKPGLYKDLAWAVGCRTDTSCAAGDSNAVLASSIDPGVVTDNFVGTQVNIVKEDLSTTSVTGQVLGASTSLPATGGKTIWVILATLLVLAGGGLMLLGFKKKMFVIILALLAGFTFLAQKPALAFDSLSVRIEQPKSPTKETTFDINFVALDILGRPVTAQCFKKGPSDGSFSQFGSNINLAAGGNSGNCHVDSGIINSNGSTYQFYVKALAGADTATSATDTVDYNTSGPGTPSNYSKDRLNSCQYKINFKTNDDGGKTVKVEIYRSTSTSFNLNSGTRVGTVSIGSNSTGSFTDTVPDCGATYYYEIRAFDSAGNGSGVVGDDVNVTTTSTTPSAGGGAIPVSGSNIPAGPSVLGEKTATGEGGVLGEATPSPEVKELPNPANAPSNYLWLLGLLALLGLLSWYALYRRRQS